jgi:hypothetical protein
MRRRRRLKAQERLRVAGDGVGTVASTDWRVRTRQMMQLRHLTAV